MKINWLKIFLITIFCVSVHSCIAQYIIAGQTTINDTYTDIIPDSAITGIAAHLAPPGETMDLDIDNNGTMDFRISAGGGGGLGGGSGSCYIVALGAHASVATTVVTVTCCCPQDYAVTIADSIVYGDTLSDQITYSQSAYLWATTYGWLQGPCTGARTFAGERYIGIRLSNTHETRYGWIRAEGVGGGTSFTLTVKDFACNKSHYSSNNSEEALFKAAVYPIPVQNNLTIQLNEANPEGTAVTLAEISGKILLSTVCYEQFCNVDFNRFNAGVYFVKVISRGRTMRFKVLKME